MVCKAFTIHSIVTKFVSRELLPKKFNDDRLNYDIADDIACLTSVQDKYHVSNL